VCVGLCLLVFNKQNSLFFLWVWALFGFWGTKTDNPHFCMGVGPPSLFFCYRICSLPGPFGFFFLAPFFFFLVSGFLFWNTPPGCCSRFSSKKKKLATTQLFFFLFFSFLKKNNVFGWGVGSQRGFPPTKTPPSPLVSRGVFFFSFFFSNLPFKLCAFGGNGCFHWLGSQNLVFLFFFFFYSFGVWRIVLWPHPKIVFWGPFVLFFSNPQPLFFSFPNLLWGAPKLLSPCPLGCSHWFFCFSFLSRGFLPRVSPLFGFSMRFFFFLGWVLLFFCFFENFNHRKGGLFPLGRLVFAAFFFFFFFYSFLPTCWCVPPISR